MIIFYDPLSTIVVISKRGSRLGVKAAFIGVIAAFFFQSVFAEEPCALDLGMSIRVHNDKVTYVSAGDQVELWFDLDFQNIEAMANYKMLALQVVGQNTHGVDGSRVLHGILDLKSINLWQSQRIVLKSTQYMAGTYQLSMAIMAITENQCFVKLPDLSDYSVIVNNQQELYDIYPPSYINFALEKSTVPMGDEIRIKVFYNDKFNICTQELSDNRVCKAIKHARAVKLKEGSVEKFDLYDYRIENCDGDNALGCVEVVLGSGGLTPGKYRLTLLDILDIAGNLAFKILGENQPVFTVLNADVQRL